MAQHMGASRRHRQSGIPQTMRENMIYRRRHKRAGRSTKPEEYFPLAGLRSSAPQVAQQDVSSLAAQREIERVVGLNLDDPQSLMSPIQIVQFQTNQFRTAQSISRRQVKESPVTPSLSIG